MTVGDCREVLAGMAPESVAAVVTDPPYHLTQVSRNGSPRQNDPATPFGRTKLGGDRGFMGSTWDGGDVAADPATWRAVYRVMKPGAHLVAFSGTRTYHRMVCAIEDAGFEIRDQIAWIFASGFPKSANVSKHIDRMAGVEGERIPSGLGTVRRIRPGADQNKDGSWEKLTDRTYEHHDYEPATEAAREWEGWGTAMKPAHEPVVLARKPLSESTVAANVLRWGTGALNIDAGRVEGSMDGVWGTSNTTVNRDRMFNASPAMGEYRSAPHQKGRWPANVAHDGNDEVMAAFARFGDKSTGNFSGHRNEPKTKDVFGAFDLQDEKGHVGDEGSAARFFYSAKAAQWERVGSHPTVKPVALMEWLVGMVAPPGGVVLDPFCGTGSTLAACDRLGFDCIGIDMQPEAEQWCRDRIARYRARRAIGEKAPAVRSEAQMDLFGG